MKKLQLSLIILIFLGLCTFSTLADAYSGSNITSFQLTSTVGGTLPFTIGLAFKKGDIAGAPALDIADQQIIVKKTWNDGSVKHAVASGSVTLVANTPFTVNVYSLGGYAGTNLTSADISTAAPTGSVQCGAIGTVNLASLLSSPVRTWISGPEMVECHYRSVVGSDPKLVVWFQVRLYKNGRLWIRAITENGWLEGLSAQIDKSYIPTVTIGGTVVYNNGGSALSHYAQTRWIAEGWIGGDATITPKHDTTYLINTKLVPNYWQFNPTESKLNGLAQTYTPNNRGGISAAMGNVGYHDHIGLLPLWDALYITSYGDSRAYNSVLTNSFSINSFPIVWRDSTTGFVPKITDHPTYQILPASYGSCSAPLAEGGLCFDLSHSPSEGYLAYLITGDYFHYETLLMQVCTAYFWISPLYHKIGADGYGYNRRMTIDARGLAWQMRNMVTLAAIFPTGDEIATEYQNLLINNIGYYKAIVDRLGGAGLGYLFEYHTDTYGPGLNAPWQHHFVIQSLGFGSNLEPLSNMTDYNIVRDWWYRGAVGILGDASGFCFNYASLYNIKTNVGSALGATTDPATWYQTWATVWSETYAGSPPACANTLQGTSAGAPSAASHMGYWGELLPAISYAVDHGATGASVAWARLIGATNWADVEASAGEYMGFHNLPQWGIIPWSFNHDVSTYVPYFGIKSQGASFR